MNKLFRYLLGISIWMAAFYANAQTITIKSVSLQPSDKTAIQNPCLDNNNDTCALIKIKTDNLEGIEFTNSNQFIEKSYCDGVYSVYVPSLSRKLDFQHKDYLPVRLDMADYGYRKLRKGSTYLVILDAPKLKDLKSSVILKVEPKQSKITFDDKDYETIEEGIYEIPVTTGTHRYVISDPNYHTQNGSVSVGNSEVKTVTVRLQPITHDVLIRCNVDNARVFVDNLNYGKVGKLPIPQGEHIIRVQADGYVDSEQNVSVNASTELSFVLEENKRITHIHATPVTIFSSSSNIYKNNKKIKEWSNGATIMFMPGKYLLSDDDGITTKIEVGSEPMEVRLDSKSAGLISNHSKITNKTIAKQLSNKKLTLPRDTSKKVESNQTKSAAVEKFIGKLISNPQSTSKKVE